MWWLICSAPDFWGSGLGFESLTVNNSEDRQSHCIVYIYCKISGQSGKPPLRQNKTMLCTSIICVNTEVSGLLRLQLRYWHSENLTAFQQFLRNKCKYAINSAELSDSIFIYCTLLEKTPVEKSLILHEHYIGVNPRKK